jgi:hypothetical protein
LWSLCWSPPRVSFRPFAIFLIDINDIEEKLLSLTILFANDISLGYSSQNVGEIENVINHDLCEVNT